MSAPKLMPFARPFAGAPAASRPAWRKPPCLVCEAPDPCFGVGCDPTKGEDGLWFCRDHVPPDFWDAANAPAVARRSAV
jgi:hypothetical protein